MTMLQEVRPLSFGVLTIYFVLQAMRLDKQMREQHVQHAVLCLNRKAAVLVEYVEAEMCVARVSQTLAHLLPKARYRHYRYQRIARQ